MADARCKNAVIISGFQTQWGNLPATIKQKINSLLLAAGCGVTPIMSMRRWLAKNRPQADVQVISQHAFAAGCYFRR